MPLFRSTSLRLAAAYSALFGLAVLVLGGVTILAARQALERELDSRIQAEALGLEQEYHIEGVQGVVQAVNERDRTPGALDYGFQSADGRAITGRLATARTPNGWATLPLAGSSVADREQLRVLTMRMTAGERLLVGENLERVAILDAVVVRAFGLALLGVLLLGGGSAFALSRHVQRRFGEMSSAAEAIIDGDLARRIPLSGSRDDLDALATTLNRMLDRISTLMESLRQVSNDIAHDLRTPLTRLRHRLEASLADGAAGHPTAIEGALGDLDAILDTFAALLRIAQIEGGARRAGFRRVELSAIAAEVVEAFAPSAEEAGHALSLACGEPIAVDGDRELLTQMLVNLVDNGLRHTPAGSAIEVSSKQGPEGAILVVRDSGAGVPTHERDRVLDRFVRLEQSRSTPGSGLGLALVAAIVRLHDATLQLGDAAPGLEVRIVFPPSERKDESAPDAE